MLYTRLSKLAHANPELRKHLVPLLRKFAGEAPMQEEGFEGKDEEKKSPAAPAAPAPSGGRKKKGPPPKWDEFLKAVYNGGKAKLPNPNTDPKIRERHPDLLISTILSEYPESPTAKGVMKKYKEWLKDQGKGSGKAKPKTEEPKPESKPKSKAEAPKPKLEKGVKFTHDGDTSLWVSLSDEHYRIISGTTELEVLDVLPAKGSREKMVVVRHRGERGEIPYKQLARYFQDEPKARKPKGPKPEKDKFQGGPKARKPKGPKPEKDKKARSFAFKTGKKPSSWKGANPSYRSADVTDELKTLNEKLGTKLTPESITSLIGMPYVDWQGRKPEITVMPARHSMNYHSGELIRTYTKSGYVLNLTRAFGVDSKGKAYIYNDTFILDEDMTENYSKPPEAMGGRVFINQVIEAHQAGFDYIKCEALYRPPKWKGGRVWPHLGYDGVIPFDEPCCPSMSYDTAPPLPTELEQKMKDKGFMPPWRISHLWQVDGGRDWWDKNGVTFKGEFDLTPGSYSMKFIEKYIPKKAAKLGLSVEEYLSGSDYLKEGMHSRYGSLEQDWADYLMLTAAKKDKGKGKKDNQKELDKDSGKGHDSTTIDKFDKTFSRDYWKTFKKGKK